MIDENISLRFRFSTYDFDETIDVTFESDNGWFVDDFELMDLETYLVEASISGDNAETVTDGVREIIIDSDRVPTSTEDLLEGVDVTLTPNPADDNLTLTLNSDRTIDANISIVSLDGRVMGNKPTTLFQDQNIINLDVSQYAAGFYILQIASEGRIITKKLVIE